MNIKELFLMKWILFPILIGSFFFQCSAKKEERQSSNNLDTLSLENILPIEQATLEDSIKQIREWFGTINRNAEAGNYERNDHQINTDSFSIHIIEYSERSTSARKKVVYKSNANEYDLPLRNDASEVLTINREYYYWDDKLFFIYEILEIREDSLIHKFENRFYLSKDRMIRWIEGKTLVESHDTLYQAIESDIFEQNAHLLQPYNYYKEYQRTDKLLAESNEQLWGSIYKYIDLKHPDKESLKTIYVNNFKNKYWLEVSSINKEIKESYLYVFETVGQKSTLEAHGKLFAKLPERNDLIKNPSEFLYYMMKLVEKKDTLRLRELIPKEGYETNVTVAIGDNAPQYEQHSTISRDTINFSHIGFFLGYSAFEHHLTIDDSFDQNGEASISYWGGGFQETVNIKKIKNKVYLISHRSLDH